MHPYSMQVVADVFKADRPLHHRIILNDYFASFDKRNLTLSYKKSEARLLQQVFDSVEISDPNYPTVKRSIDTFDLCNPLQARKIIDAIYGLHTGRKKHTTKVLKAIRRYALFVKDTHTIHSEGQPPLYLPTLYGPIESPVSSYDIPREPTDKGPNHRYLTGREYKAWLKYTYAQVKPATPLVSQHKAYTFHAMCVVAGETGMRLQEILGICSKDIHWDDKKLLVTQGKGSKGSGHRKRMVSLSPLALATLQEYIAAFGCEAGDYVFKGKLGQPLSINTAHGWMRQAKKDILAKNLPIYLPDGFGWHGFRRTFTKKAIKQGIGIEALKRNNGWAFTSTISYYYGDEKPPLVGGY